MTITRHALLSVLALAVLLAACTSAPPQRTPPIGSLPDPAAFMPAPALAALLGGSVEGPACRYAEIQYRCIWTDAANAERSLRVAVYRDIDRVTERIADPGARAVSVAGASQAAMTANQGEIIVWAVVGERGLEVAFAPDDAGDPAAYEAAVLAMAGALAAALGR